MNRVLMIGRLTNDPEIRRTVGENATTVARYSIAVDRGGQDNKADFFRCVAYNKSAEFVEKYLRKGMKIAIDGHLTSGQYTNAEGKTVYTTDITVERHEFCEKKTDPAAAAAPAEQAAAVPPAPATVDESGFMNIPDGVEDEGLPFN